MSALSAPVAVAAPELPAISPVLRSHQECRTGSTVELDEKPWAQAQLRPERAWPHGNGAGVTVAVVGSGVDATSPALAGRVTGAGPDCVGYGTFVAGIIAAAPRPGGGFSGVAPGARILAVQATDQQGNATADSLAGGIRQAVAGGARIISVAAEAAAPSDSLAAAVREAAAAGVVVVAPASTGTGEEVVPAFPAAYPEVLSVAAIDPKGAPALVAPGVKVDIAAPGVAMTGIGPRGNGLFISGGDAVAAAQVSGTAALALSYRPNLTGADLARRLRDTAYPPPGGAPHPLLGSGVVDPATAVTAEFPTAEGKPPVVPAAVHMPPPVDPTPDITAAIVATAAAVVIGTAAALAVVIPRGRKRRWRPAP
ncbi:S8 family serine peptidase [Saccharopolyspora kobensis]|uniref:S8 family serine peptidase n=2 Tax=Saccharopolyspora kobensis TaxID=146035 RepID=UPI0015A4F078|nr:S8 family serine peptidase [Saccharopolyspora kobensis]